MPPNSTNDNLVIYTRNLVADMSQFLHHHQLENALRSTLASPHEVRKESQLVTIRPRGDTFNYGNIDGQELEVLAKITIMDEMDENAVEKSIKLVLNRLKVKQVTILVLSFMSNISQQQMIRIWKAAEQQVKTGLVQQLGVSDFNKEMLETFLPLVEMPPKVAQIHVTQGRCINNSEELASLINYGKSNDIRILYHDDNVNIHAQLVVNYSVIIKTRGVVVNKGYAAVF